MDEILNAILRTIVSFVFLMMLTIFFGKQINSQNNYFNYALSITIGSYIANMGFDTNLKFLPLVLSFTTLTLIYFFMRILSFQFLWVRKWFSGLPAVFIENGEILEQNMKKSKYTLDNLNQQLRELGIFNIEEVEKAILEVSGKLSVLKKEPYLTILKKDLSINNTSILKFPIEIIIEGNILTDNFKFPYNQSWLDIELRNRKLNAAEIFYAVLSTNGHLFIDRYEKIND